MGMVMRGSLSQVMVLLLIAVAGGGGHGVKEYHSSKKNVSGSTSNYGGSMSLCVGLHCLDDHVEAYYDSFMGQHDDQVRRMLGSNNMQSITGGTQQPGTPGITCPANTKEKYTTCNGDGKGSPCRTSDYQRVKLGKC